MEYWKEIAGYNGDYLVSSLGRIKMCLWCAMSKAEIASIFDVCVQRIDEISRERGWAHVKLTVA